LASVIESKVYAALGLSRDLVKEIEHEEPPLAAVAEPAHAA
jgi:hypothetical protein